VTNILDLLSRMIWLFPKLVNHLVGITGILAALITKLFEPGTWKALSERFEGSMAKAGLRGDEWGVELGEYLTKVAEGICWFFQGGTAW
jgi:hypothetical protein